MSVSPPIVIELGSRAARLIERYQAMPLTITRAVKEGLDDAMPGVLRKISLERLDGQGPYPVEEHRLGVRSRNLRASTYITPAVVVGNAVSASIGSPMRYAGVHEFGFTGDVQVRAHTRKHFGVIDLVDPSKKRGFSQRKVRKADVQVGTFTRHMNIPARAPFGFGLADCTALISRKVSERVIAALDPKGTES